MQLDLFQSPEFSVNKKIRLIELFAGYGSQSMALERIGADFEHHFVCEFDKYAVESFNAVHGTSFTPSDIRNVHAEDFNITEKDKYCYLMTYSFPCVDLSVAGKQQGMSKEDYLSGKSTRSGLLWEVERIMKELDKKDLPDVLLMENVTQVHGTKNIEDFKTWINFLESLGYSNFYHDMNAKNYGVAQNRDRCFMVSILGDWSYQFPKEIPLEKRMVDYLEDEVEEKYFLKSEKAQQLIDRLILEKKIPE